jgi:hypothetical protein
VPIQYQVYVEYYDDTLDRFWFTTIDFTEPDLLTPRQLDVAVQDAVQSFLAGGGYEALETYIEEQETTPIYSVESVIRT